MPAKAGIDGTRSKSNELDAPPMIPGGTINIGLGNSLHEKPSKITDNGGEVDGNGNRGKTRRTTAGADSISELATLL